MSHLNIRCRNVPGDRRPSIQDVVLVRQFKGDEPVPSRLSVVRQISGHLRVALHRSVPAGIPFFAVKGIRHIMYIWRLGDGSADEHPHLMSRQKRLYDSPCLLHLLQRCGYSELYLFFLILSRIIPRGDNRRFRFRQDLILFTCG